jgi:hypothetical protein
MPGSPKHPDHRQGWNRHTAWPAHRVCRGSGSTGHGPARRQRGGYFHRSVLHRFRSDDLPALAQGAPFTALRQEQPAPGRLLLDVDDVPQRAIHPHPNQDRLEVNLDVLSGHISAGFPSTRASKPRIPVRRSRIRIDDGANCRGTPRTTRRRQHPKRVPQARSRRTCSPFSSEG